MMDPGYHKLAVHVIAHSCKTLTLQKPVVESYKSPSHWRIALDRWARDREFEFGFWADPKRSVWWCEAAGFDWDAMVQGFPKAIRERIRALQAVREARLLRARRCQPGKRKGAA